MNKERERERERERRDPINKKVLKRQLFLFLEGAMILLSNTNLMRMALT